MTLDGNKLTVADDFVARLRANGLDSFEKIMNQPATTVVRSVPGRATVRLKLNDGLVVFLKRYEPRYYSWWERLAGIHDEARQEWRMLHELRQHGFNTAPPVATGRDGRRSFVMTAEIAGGVPSDQLLRDMPTPKRREFINRLAEVTRRFHQQGFIHRDYYLSHFFVVDGGTLYILDLQRVRHNASQRQRWLIKDLGALCYSAQVVATPATDLVRFYKSCFEIKKLRPADKRLIRRILRRAARLHRRRHKYKSPIAG